MTPESQNIEYKETWRDEYLKWICGFANAQGGVLDIGIRDDDSVVGISNSKKLLEEISNKIKDTMGITADVNLLTEDGKEYIEIVVNPSSAPISYKGEYHYRTGSTRQLLRGSALTQFLMDKTGYRWDAVPVGNIGVKDLDELSFEIFRKEAKKWDRIPKDALSAPNAELLERLNLTTEGKLTRAAVMLFCKNPGRIATGYYVKVGKFAGETELLYQDTVEGSLLRIANSVIDLIFTKYLKAPVSFKHDLREEPFPFPREGVREAVYNALVHNDYALSVPIQIRIEDEAMYISNNCILPTGWTAETLTQPHRSVPFNPSIAGVFYRAGFIENWGRGIRKVFESCREIGAPDPEYTVLGDSITVKFTALKSAVIPQGGNGKKVAPKIAGKQIRKKTSKNFQDESKLEEKILALIANQKNISQSMMAERLKVSLKTVQRTIAKLKAEGRVIRKGEKRSGYWELL
ncbi:MAG: putative DNA binding domain-containing protein [Thermoguttaceae bacterium]|nr:putative DNA binding domain-containing protein [Thermoguttaceae bacterium]